MRNSSVTPTRTALTKLTIWERPPPVAAMKLRESLAVVREPSEERDGDVPRRQADELAVRVEVLAVASGERLARQHARR